jgi:hypothetical protein
LDPCYLSTGYILGGDVSFESRYHRFVYISDVSVLNERVWVFLRVKHMLYLFLAVIFLWRGCSAGSPAMLSMGAVAGALALLSGSFSRGSMSFEARLLALIVSAVSSMGSSKEKSVKAKGKEHTKEENKLGD